MELEAQIRRYIAENFLFSDDGYPFDDDTSFLSEAIIDSTGVLELVMFVEENFGIAVSNDDLVPDNFDSVANLAGYIRRKRNT